MKVEFKKLRLKNFMSFGNSVSKINFDSGLNLVSGTNGTGKSTLMLDAISFALFDKPYRKVNKADLLNRVNKKGLMVDFTFEVNGIEYRIVRGIKNKEVDLEFYIDGTIQDCLSSKGLNQEEIEKKIGIDYKLFKQIISLSINYNKPFLTLSAGEKRELLEKFCNIDVLASMLKKAKDGKKDYNIKKQMESQAIELLSEILEPSKKRILDLEESKKNFKADKLKEISEIEKKIEDCNQEMKDIKKSGVSKKKDVETYNSELEKYTTELKEISESELNKYDDELEKYNSEIESFVPVLEKHTTKIRELNESLSRDDDNSEIKELESQITAISKDIGGCEINIKNATKQISTLNEYDICPTCNNELKGKYKENEIDKQKKIITDENTQIEKYNNTISEINEKIKKINKKKSDEKNVIRKQLEEINEKISKENSKKEKVYEKISEVKNKKDEIKNKVDAIKENINSTNDKIKDVKYEMKTLKSNYLSFEEKIKDFEERIEKLKKEEFAVDINSLKKEYNDKKAQHVSHKKELEHINKQLEYYDVVVNMLSDKGIKAYIFEQLIPVLNESINNYLNIFELPVYLEFDNQMNDSIKAINNFNEEVKYYSFSEGEKKRIDMAILLSFIDVTKKITNWNCNLLIIDELLDSSIDDNGLEKFLKSLHKMAKDDVGIYIISHKFKEEFKSYFNKTIQIVKEQRFSKIQTM